MSWRSIEPRRHSRAPATGPRCKSTTRPAARQQAAASSTEATMDLGLKGKNVLVTGGSKGIGLAVAELFADEGANVAICARNAEEVDKVVKALAEKHVKAWGKALDVADPTALTQWVDGAAAELGGIDALVCNVSALAVGNT